MRPLFLAVYVNDLPECAVNSVCKLYADDIKIFYVYKTLDQTDIFQNDLCAAEKRAIDWQLNISILNTFLLYFGNKNPKQAYQITNTVITSKENVQNLGIYITTDQSWSIHCQETARKANDVSYFILYSFKSHEVNLYMRAFNVYVRPVLDYCSYIRNSLLCKDINILENVKNCFTNHVFKKC